MKTMERMTNPYFQDIDFAKVLKGKHVRQDPDEPDNEFEYVEQFSSQEVGNDGGSDREEIDENHSFTVDPLTIQPSRDLIEEGPRRLSRLRDQDSGSERENIDVNQSYPIQPQRGKQLNIAQRQSTRSGKNLEWKQKC